jgi:hypothetical protein
MERNALRPQLCRQPTLGEPDGGEDIPIAMFARRFFATQAHVEADNRETACGMISSNTA